MYNEGDLIRKIWNFAAETIAKLLNYQYYLHNEGYT